MLRAFRAADAPTFIRLLKQNFPEEEAVLETDPVAALHVARGIFRPHVRFGLWLAGVLGHPIVRFYVTEVDGAVAGTTILTFQRNAGFVSGVVVDAPFRHRGLARRMLDRARSDARKARRPYVALDVLSRNAPARTLYESLGYTTLREQTVLVRDPAPTPAAPVAPTGVRPFRGSDAEPLERLAQGLLPPIVAEVLPADAGQFRVRPLVVRALRSDSRAWVADAGEGPVAFLRATVSSVTAAANLAGPIRGLGVDDRSARALVDLGIAWITSTGPRRIIAEVGRGDVRNRAVLEAAGFRPAYDLETMYRST